jgi:hypothetical protein
MNTTLKCSALHVVEIEMLRVMEKKILKVKLRGKAEDAIQGLGHHDSPLILKMTCAAKPTEIPAREN